MLTSIYYYRYYRPYILRTVDNTGIISPRRTQIARKPDVDPEAVFLLNKSLKVDVVAHAKQTSGAINGVKNGARRVIDAIEGFNQNTFDYGLHSAREVVCERLSDYAQAYNQSVGFMSGQSHSGSLQSFAEDLVAITMDSRHELELLDLYTDDGRTITFMQEDFQHKDQQELNIAFGESIDGFMHTYKDATVMLTRPLSDHMNFKSLNYYYNYKLGTMVSDTFKIIEAGLIINKRL